MARVQQFLDCNEDFCGDLKSCEADPVTLEEFTDDMKPRTIRLKVGNALRCYDVESLYQAVRGKAVEPTTRVPFTRYQLKRLQRAHERLHPIDEKTGVDPLADDVPPDLDPEFHKLLQRGERLADQLTRHVMHTLQSRPRGQMVNSTIWARVMGSYHDKDKPTLLDKMLDKLASKLNTYPLFILTPDEPTSDSPERTLWVLAQMVEWALTREAFDFLPMVHFLTLHNDHFLSREHKAVLQNYDREVDGIGHFWEDNDAVQVTLKRARRFLDQWNRFQNPEP